MRTTPWRRLTAVAALLLAGSLAACGPIRGAPAASSNAVVTATPAIATPSPNPSPSAAPSPTQGPLTPPASLVAGSTTVGIGYEDAASTGMHLGILLPDGTRHEIAIATTTPGVPWWDDISETDGGVVANAAGRLIELRADGSSRDLGPVPALMSPPGSDIGFAISPDGTQVAFATSTISGANVDNRLYVCPIGGTPRVIAERTAVTNSTQFIVPGADSPALWEYSVRSWTRQGILIVRAPENVGGGGPFLSYDWFTAIVDPATGNSVDLTNGKATPLNSYSDTGQWVTVDWNGQSGTEYNGAEPTMIEVGAVGGGMRTYPVDGTEMTGDGVIDVSGERLAYATLDTAAYNAAPSGTGWFTMYQLHVLDLTTGQSRTVGPTGLNPIAWTADGRVIARRYTTADAPGTASYVLVDPSTGAVQPLATTTSSWATVVVTTPPAG